jgi:serine/threonine protein kinase
MSPETLLSNVYSFKSDIWALGIVLYEMLFGEVPFFFPNEKDLKQNFQSYQQNNFL